MTELCAGVAVAAVHREPAAEDAGRRRLGDVAPGRHVALLRAGAALDVSAARLWPLIREQASGSAAAEQDARRAEGVLNERRSKSQQFFSSAASQWDRLRGELFGQQFQHDTVLAMLDPRLRVGDLGCGTGQFSALIRPTSRTWWPSMPRPRC